MKMIPCENPFAMKKPRHDRGYRNNIKALLEEFINSSNDTVKIDASEYAGTSQLVFTLREAIKRYGMGTSICAHMYNGEARLWKNSCFDETAYKKHLGSWQAEALANARARGVKFGRK